MVVGASPLAVAVLGGPQKPTGRRETPPDDRLRDMRVKTPEISPDIAALIQATLT